MNSGVAAEPTTPLVTLGTLERVPRVVRTCFSQGPSDTTAGRPDYMTGDPLVGVPSGRNGASGHRAVRGTTTNGAPERRGPGPAVPGRAVRLPGCRRRSGRRRREVRRVPR